MIHKYATVIKSVKYTPVLQNSNLTNLLRYLLQLRGGKPGAGALSQIRNNDATNWIAFRDIYIMFNYCVFLIFLNIFSLLVIKCTGRNSLKYQYLTTLPHKDDNRKANVKNEIHFGGWNIQLEFGNKMEIVDKPEDVQCIIHAKYIPSIKLLSNLRYKGPFSAKSGNIVADLCYLDGVPR